MSATILGKYDLVVDLCVQSQVQLRNIMDQFRRDFTTSYAELDILDVKGRYVTGWKPFRTKKQ